MRHTVNDSTVLTHVTLHQFLKCKSGVWRPSMTNHTRKLVHT